MDLSHDIRRLVYAIICIACMPSALAYIDPGTGGYLVTSLWPLFLGFLAIVGSFFLRYVIKPVKKWWWVIVLLILTIIALSWAESPKEITYDTDLNVSGVTLYNRSAAFDGYNLYNGKLLDMQGNIVNQWNFSYLGYLYPNGDYLAQEGYESERFGKFTWDDQPIWIKNIPIHHELFALENGNIITFTKEVQEYNGRLVEFDVVLELDADGNILKNWSLWQNLSYLQTFHRELQLDKPPSFLLPEDMKKNISIWGGEYDYYHLNSLSIIPETNYTGIHPAFKPGNWLISFRHGSMSFIVDKETQEVHWMAIDDQVQGNLEGPHGPQMMSNGSILIFDNGRYREWSRIIEIDPVSLEILWEYKADDFFTYSQGYAQRLPNGNTLATESEAGRIFEITRDGQIVWQYLTPETAKLENQAVRDEIYRFIRYPKEYLQIE